MNILTFDYTLLIRLVVALVLGGIIGLERGRNNHDAGLRTHMVLCLGAALVMVISTLLCKEYEIYSEMLRMSAQVLSGIGFLGAGSIIATGNRIRGITTAAGLWTTACVGIAVGAGYYIPAVVTVLLMLFVMFALRPITKKIQSYSLEHNFIIEIKSKETIKEIVDEMENNKAEILNYHFDEDNMCLDLEMKVEKRTSINNIISSLTVIDGVVGFKIAE